MLRTCKQSKQGTTLGLVQKGTCDQPYQYCDKLEKHTTGLCLQSSLLQLYLCASCLPTKVALILYISPFLPFLRSLDPQQAAAILLPRSPWDLGIYTRLNLENFVSVASTPLISATICQYVCRN